VVISRTVMAGPAFHDFILRGTRDPKEWMPGTRPRLSGSGFRPHASGFSHPGQSHLSVMAVLVTAIHALRRRKKDVNARHKAGHDD
jgi:hypothetical protein